MKVEKLMNGEELTLKVTGRIDTTNAKDFEDVVTTSLVDFAGLDYISSAGLRVLLIAIKQMKRQGSMKVIHTNEMVQEIFEVTGFNDLVEIS